MSTWDADRARVVSSEVIYHGVPKFPDSHLARTIASKVVSSWYQTVRPTREDFRPACLGVSNTDVSATAPTASLNDRIWNGSGLSQ